MSGTNLVNFLRKFLIPSLVASGEYAFANRTFQCDLSNGASHVRVLLKSHTPDRFPDNYQTLVLQEMHNGEVADSQTYHLEKLQGDLKAAVFRFFVEAVNEMPKIPRYGIFAWNPGTGSLYLDGTNTRFAFAWAGATNCREVSN